MSDLIQGIMRKLTLKQKKAINTVVKRRMKNTKESKEKATDHVVTWLLTDAISKENKNE